MIRALLRPYIWYIKDFFEERRERIEGKNKNICYINWWSVSNNELQWFTKFIEYNINENINKNINFYSVMGPVKFLKEKTEAIKIFYTGENVSQHRRYKSLKENKYRVQKFIRRRYLDYSNYGVDDVDLSLGFEDVKNDKYIRFPLWIIYFFEPRCNYVDIKNKIDFINNLRNKEVLNEAVVINGHDYFGTRSKICDDVKNILNIKYAGKWRNNTTDLWNKYNNNKLEYIKQFKFNICPENMDANQYVTEKIFEALYAGTIPIYHGAFNNPEPGIINRDRIILWDFEGDNEENIKLIKRLKNDETFYNKYINQEKLLPYTAEFVYSQMEKLKEKIRDLL